MACAGLSHVLPLLQAELEIYSEMPKGIAHPGQHSQGGKARSAKQMSSQTAGSSEGHGNNPGQDPGKLGICLGSVTKFLYVLGQVTLYTLWSTLEQSLWYSVFPSIKWEKLDKKNFLTLTVYLLLQRTQRTS